MMWRFIEWFVPEFIVKKSQEDAVYSVTGEAKDQETIVRQRQAIEEYVRESGEDFSRTELFWNLNEDGNFDFEIKFIQDGKVN